MITSPHDRVFRASLKNIQVAREYFEKYLPPEILKVVNLDVLIPCPEIYVNKYLKLSESDMVYKTEIAGETGYICLAGEHQSQGEIFLPLRVLEYNVCIWQFDRKQRPNAKKLPLIINVVFYTGKGPYPYSTDFKDLLDAPRELVEAFWTKPFTLVEAQNLPDEELLCQKWAGLFMYFMKHIHAKDLLPHLASVLPLMKAIDEKNGVEYLEAVSHYALAAGEISDAKKFVETLQNELSQVTGEKIMTGLEQLIEIGKREGMQQGVQQGMQQGFQRGTLEGERALLKRLLTRRFGEVPSQCFERIENADADSLLKWSDNIIDAKAPEDIFKSYH